MGIKPIADQERNSLLPRAEPTHVSPGVCALVHVKHLILSPARSEKPLNGAPRTRQPSAQPRAAARARLLLATVIVLMEKTPPTLNFPSQVSQ